MRGIDISHHNGWPFNAVTEQAYQESDFVNVKATQWETSYKWEDYFAKAIARANSDKKLIGAYHYATGLDPIKEADHFISVVNGYKGKALLALDWEVGDNKSWGSTTWAKRFLDRVYEKTKIRPFIYTGTAGAIQCSNCAKDYPLWFAGYPVGANSWAVPPWPSRYNTGAWEYYTIWQFTSGNGTLDRNTTSMTKEQWMKYAAAEGTKVTKKKYTGTFPVLPTRGYFKKGDNGTVKVGSARIDERGRISGGTSGDQTKNEVGTQDWYLHSKGWYVLRAKSASDANKIATAMQKACDNQNIGYDQNQRNTLYNLASKVQFDPSKVTQKCETDCSALVRVCLAYAGIRTDDFNTSLERAVISGTGKFVQIADSRTKSKLQARRGDILVTKTKGHTVVCLDDGYTGEQVKNMQKFLNWAVGTNLKVDGSFGDKTLAAVKKFQKLVGLEQDGKFGKNTLAKAKSYVK